MRYRFLFLLGMIPFLAIGQNPLKKELKGNGTSMHYSPSQFSFTNQNGVTVYVADLKDRRSINWNKQVNDSVKIEAIGDFWNYPMAILFKNKINQDLTKANINVDYSAQGENIFKLDPVLDVLYPNFVSYPEKGYWVLAKINMQVSKGSQVLFAKSYQEYTFFDKNISGYKEGYNSDLKEGANVAMWSSVKRLLDQFYKDLNSAFVGQPVSSSDVTLNTIGVSKIVSDPNLNNQVSNYSGSKVSQDSMSANNYKIDGEVPLPIKHTDSKLDNAVNVLGSAEPKIVPSLKKTTSIPLIDSAKLAERKIREEMRKKAVDSARKAREELALNTKKIEQQEKEKLQFKRDSLLQVKKAVMAAKLRERFVSDSIKKAEVNKKIDEAKALTKEKRNQLKKESLTENNISSSKNDEPAIEKKKPQSIAKKPLRKVANESISDAVRRIAQEVEDEEESGIVTSKKTSYSEVKPEVKIDKKAEELKTKRSEEVAKAKAEREKALAEMRLKKMQKDSLLTLEKQKKQDSLMAIRKAKALEIEAAMARAKATKDSINRILAAKKYVEDSIQLVKEKEKRREAVLAAQKAAMEAERNTLLNNPSAGEMFASVSTDPPSKLPDSRTREQKLADRIFTPKSDNTKDLLARVKLITPEEEAKLLAQMKTDDKTIADSFFIEMQKNRPIPTHTPLDTATKSPTKKIEEPIKPSASKEDKKAQIIEKGLKGAKNLKDVPKESKKILDTTNKSIKAIVGKPNTEKTKESPIVKETISNKSEPAKIQPPVMDSSTAEQKAKDLEAEIERKKKEINERLKKAKQW